MSQLTSCFLRPHHCDDVLDGNIMFLKNSSASAKISKGQRRDCLGMKCPGTLCSPLTS
jgi:hypothetical protein